MIDFKWLHRKQPEPGEEKMPYPKWMYRKHPDLGVFQATLAANEVAAIELAAEWTDNPAEHGFAVRPVSQMHPSHHVGENLVLHEVVTDSTGKPVEATIEVTMMGDFPNVL